MTASTDNGIDYEGLQLIAALIAKYSLTTEDARDIDFMIRTRKNRLHPVSEILVQAQLGDPSVPLIESIARITGIRPLSRPITNDRDGMIFTRPAPCT